MILVAAFLLLVALGLLAGGLAEGSAAMQWGSFAASALAALTLAVGEFQRRRRDEPQAGPSAAAPAHAGAPVGIPAAGNPGGPSEPAPAAGTSPAVAPSVPAAEPAPEAAVRPAELSAPKDAPSVPSASAGVVSAQSAGMTSAHSASTAGPAGARAAVPVLGPDGEPPVEEVEVTDLLLVLDLTDEVLVVDEHPRYHVAGCLHLVDVETIPLPMVEARTDGFTPCSTCAPDRTLAGRERARRAG